MNEFEFLTLKIPIRHFLNHFLPLDLNLLTLDKLTGERIVRWGSVASSSSLRRAR